MFLQQSFTMSYADRGIVMAELVNNTIAFINKYLIVHINMYLRCNFILHIK